MNVQHPLTDDAIRAAMARRATSSGERDLREQVLAATAAVSQRRGWRVRLEQLLAPPERRTALTLAAAVLLLIAAAIGVALVGGLVERTTLAPTNRLAYLAGGDLYVAGPAGESPQLAWDPPETVALSQPMWVDAETIVVDARRVADGVSSVYLVDVPTSEPRLVDDGGHLLALSPDHRRIATAHRVGATGRMRLWIVDLERRSQVADLGEIADRTSLSWSPDGRWLLGDGQNGVSPSGLIYRVDLETGQVSDLATGLCCGLHVPRPVFSPDGSRVIFVNYHDGAGGEICDFRCGTLWALDPDTGTRQRLTDEAGSEIGPVYAPDGSWIAFMEKAVGRGYEVAIVRPDGTERHTLTSTGDAFAPAANLEPFRYLAWDADAGGLTFMRLAGSDTAFQLWHVTLDGRATRIEAPPITEFARQASP